MNSFIRVISCTNLAHFLSRNL